MKKTLSYNNISCSKLSLIYVIIVAVSVFSLLYGWVPMFGRQVFTSFIAILTTLLVAPRFFLTKQSWLILFYWAIITINVRSGDEYTFDKEVMDGLLLFMCGGVSYYLVNSDDQKAKKWISIAVLSVLIIQTAPALFIYMTSQDTIRTFIGLIYHGESEYEWSTLYKMGILAYDTTHGLPMLVPPLVMWLRTKGASRFWKAFCALGLVCILILVYIYDVTTVQLLVFGGLGLSLLIYPNQNKRNKQRIIIVSVFLMPFLFSTALQDGMLSVVESFAQGELKSKVEDVRYGLTHNDATGDVENRNEAYVLSFNTFIESPIWGTNDISRIGYHSAIFDRMACFGLLGTVPYIIILIMMIKVCRANMSQTSKWYYVVCTICFVTIILLKNMSRLEEWLMFIVVAPAMLTLDVSEVGDKSIRK